MKKRLRKKHRLGEFREDGFDILFTTHEKGPYDCTFCDRFIEFIESIQCGFGGSCGGYWCGFVTYLGRGTVTPEKRDHIVEFLRQDPVVDEIVEVGPLLDAWHGWSGMGYPGERHRWRRYLRHIDWEQATEPDMHDRHLDKCKAAFARMLAAKEGEHVEADT